MASLNLIRGWGFPFNSRKAHYFQEGSIISLCGKWLFAGERFDDKHDHPDNCKDCQRRRQRIADKELTQISESIRFAEETGGYAIPNL